MHRLRYSIGVLTLLAAALCALWFVRILRNQDERPGLAVRVEFRDARGLRSGADVRYRGVSVGTVRTVSIAGDGRKATVGMLLDPIGAAQACVNSVFWIVTPRFAGITTGASGLDTLVRDSYVTFQTPGERGSPLADGSLLAGREKPPPAADPEVLDEIEHGDLLMSVLVPENHGLRPGSAVIYRGQQTGDVRSVELAPDGSHVEVKLRIARKHRQTVTDKSFFWVARPAVTGALLSGFTLNDVSALLTPFVSYYSEPGKGVPVDDGHRVAAQPMRPSFEVAAVPKAALQPRPRPDPAPGADGIVVVRIVYDAIERDTWSADDPVRGEGSGLLLLAHDGRAIVVTARSVVDGSVTTSDAFGRAPQIEDERTKVMLPDGSVLRAVRIWVHPDGADLAVLLLEDVPPDLRASATDRLALAETMTGSDVRCAGPDGAPLAVAAIETISEGAALGGVVVASERAVGIVGAGRKVVPLTSLPSDLRPR